MVLRAPSFNALIHLSVCSTGNSGPVEPKGFVAFGSQNPESPLRLSLSVSALHRSKIRVNCINPDSEGKTGGSGEDGDFGGKLKDEPSIDGGGSGGGGGNGSSGGGGEGGGDGGDDADAYDEKEFGPLMKFEDVIKNAEARGVDLPADMIEAAKSSGIRELFLSRYLDLQAAAWPLSFLMQCCSMFRNRMLADPSFLFKLGSELAIDTCCATFAEVQKRGKDFWSEFELYLADLLVGLVVDIALVGLLAPCARFGRPSVSRGVLGRMRLASSALPGSVFEAERPGCRFSVRQRIATYFYKGVLYGSVGFTCGLIGQGIANTIMNAKRNMNKSEHDIPVPPLVQSAALWGVFLAVSSNTRYQIVNGLERIVEASPLVKKAPPVAMAFSFGVRFANNIYGGMQFVDWAKLSGVQ